MFPLPRETFPAMKFAADQTADFADCRDRLLLATMSARREFRDKYLMRLDARVWKALKTRRRPAASALQSGSAAAPVGFAVFAPRRSAQVPRPSSSPSCSPILIGAGTVAGSLDDVLLGLTNATTSTMRFAASHMHRDVLDSRVLATLQAPTEREPFEHLGLKWTAKGAPLALRRFVRPRDFVYLESTGVRRDERGQRVGHLVLHSVELPGCRSLRTQYGVVRAGLSFSFLFSESLSAPGAVDVFFKGFVDPRGGVPERIALAAAADAIMACQNAPRCARMKKYAWMVREVRDLQPSHDAYRVDDGDAAPAQAEGEAVAEAAEEDGCCTVCDVGFSAFTVSLTCGICKFHTCAACVQSVVVATAALVQETVPFCHHCVNAVGKLDAARVARDDATHTLRALRQRSGRGSLGGGDGVNCGERIKLQPLKKRCQSSPLAFQSRRDAPLVRHSEPRGRAA
ncbi:hypothetical protein PybrP1_003578 [[Pythium] brassicae (nom. inval.)]|nr:hypothetical protein PybrP1_003578 [[Pythium] brassicae (nom. inval.)]